MKAIQIVKLFIAWLFFILFLSFTESVKQLSLGVFILKGTLFYFSVFCMFASSLYGYKMMNSPKVGTEITYLIPIIFSNEYLSEQGKKYRKYFFIYLIGFFVWSFSIEWFDMYVMN